MSTEDVACADLDPDVMHPAVVVGEERQIYRHRGTNLEPAPTCPTRRRRPQRQQPPDIGKHKAHRSKQTASKLGHQHMGL